MEMSGEWAVGEVVEDANVRREGDRMLFSESRC